MELIKDKLYDNIVLAPYSYKSPHDPKLISLRFKYSFEFSDSVTWHKSWGPIKIMFAYGPEIKRVTKGQADRLTQMGFGTFRYEEFEDRQRDIFPDGYYGPYDPDEAALGIDNGFYGETFKLFQKNVEEDMKGFHKHGGKEF